MPTTGYGLAYLNLFQHIGLIFPYNASSRESWDDMVASFERMRSRCPDETLPFLATMIASIADMKVRGPCRTKKAWRLRASEGAASSRFCPRRGVALAMLSACSLSWRMPPVISSRPPLPGPPIKIPHCPLPTRRIYARGRM